MSGESDFLDKLAQSIADGASINWEEIDRLRPADAELRRMLKLLRVVADVAEVHRSPANDVSPPADQVSTKPAGDQPSPWASGGHDPSGGLGRWGHLLLLRKIGEGAFGEVYHAHDTWLDHPVALKLFKPKAASRGPSSRILHEARKLARIRHPNVVSVHGADSHNGQVGFWMDLIEGATLEQLVLAGRLSAGEATYIGQEVCRALAAVHQAEIVHRDVKAQNVMRASDGGRIILMDFGAGEFLKDKSPSSRGQGTPLYLAPEILAGEDASVQSDIYAVGVLLYYLVTGGFPVRASSVPALIDAHKRGERRRLRDGRPDLPNAFVSIVERAIDPDPARRFASAGEMEAALTGGTISDVAPINLERFRGKHAERSALQTGVFAIEVAAFAVIAAEVFGLIACRVFEVAFGIEGEFAAGPIEYFSVGVRALFPFVVFSLVCAAIVAAAAGLRPLVRSPLAAIQKRWSPMIRSLDSETLATIVFLTGAGCWLAISWACSDIFFALEALRNRVAKPVDLTVLSSRALALHTAHTAYSAVLTFLLGVAAWRWFPRMEKRAQDASRVQLLRWATVAIAFLAIASAVAPRRFFWERYEVVAFENQQALVIGTSPDELLLYSPKAQDPNRWRVRKNAAMLRRTGTTSRIFDPR